MIRAQEAQDILSLPNRRHGSLREIARYRQGSTCWPSCQDARGPAAAFGSPSPAPAAFLLPSIILDPGIVWKSCLCWSEF